VVAGLLALAAGSGWVAALLVCCLGGAATATLCWASALRAGASRHGVTGLTGVTGVTGSAGGAGLAGGTGAAEDAGIAPPVPGPAPAPGAGLSGLPGHRRSPESGDAAHRPG
jgi:hypothetical protein